MAVINGTGASDVDLEGTSDDDEINGLGGDDWIQAVQGNDTLDGATGMDALWAGSGDDTMIGGDGSDTYHVDSYSDDITEAAGGLIEGLHDRVNSYITLSLLTDNVVLAQGIEDMRLVGFGVINGEGNASANWLEGNNKNNSIAGGDGNDTIDGWDGVDTLSGEIGNDIFILDDASDMADTVDGGVGSNTVNVIFNTNLLTLNAGTLSWTNIQNITLLGTATATLTATGDNNDNIITGNVAANKLFGLDGNDNLIGGGGADSMAGGIGNDNYGVDLATDKVIDLAGQGTDSVYSSVTYTLPTASATSEVENLFLTLVASVNATGNALNNVIGGNDGSNILKGLAGSDTISGGLGVDSLDGGVGIDTTSGNEGDDVYFIDNALDVVTEVALQGTADKINATLVANAVYTMTPEVERLTLLGTVGGQTVIGNVSNNILIGNTQRNVFQGGAGLDTIDGGGGTDTMDGGLGNDTFTVDVGTDLIIEGVGEGKDMVLAKVSYSMLAFATNADDMTMSALTAVVGTGNNLDNTIIGNGAKNTISGMDGGDTLLGGGGDDIISGGDGNDTSIDGQVGKDTMSGGLGDDVYKVENIGDIVTELAAQGTDGVVAFINYFLTANVENLEIKSGTTGGGNNLANAILGNGGANVLLGFAQNDAISGIAGNDTIDGGTGDDAMDGGFGNDTFYVDSALDTVTEELTLQLEIDVVYSTATYTLAAGEEIEGLTLLGAAALDATGNEFSNTLTANSGVNTLAGGLGNDRLVVDSLLDRLVENVGEGFDFVAAPITFDLGAGYLAGQELEGLQLFGSDNINGFGNALDNRLIGNVGNNVLTGRLGNDTYVVTSGSDIFVELVGEGTDFVESSITYTLSPVAPTYQIEGLRLVGLANIDGTGNGLDNFIIGNDGNNTLWGGIGNDALTGGKGNDTYIVDDATLDPVTELVGEGTDTVRSSATYNLSIDGPNTENLFLTGVTNIDGTGTDLVNTIGGNDGSNSLFGMDGKDTLDGGAGADTMNGGLGDDTFFADNLADYIVEGVGAAEGTKDTVYATNNYNMNFVPNTEEVEFMFAIAGDSDINITGNDYGQSITGNDGDNALNGAGGDDMLIGGNGVDVLAGGLGNDGFLVDSFSGLTIIEFTGGGSDTVYMAFTYTLPEFTATYEIENIGLLGTAALNAFGNSATNFLGGNNGNNTLSGMGGIDNYAGGLGNDTYIVDNTAETATELVGQGTDTVISSATFTLGLNVENLTLTGATNIDGTGNDLVNTITGNSGNNILSGGLLADTYVIQNAGDVVVEVASIPLEYDLIISSVTHTLETDVENMTLTGSLFINGTGNTMDNTIRGNLGTNTLLGLDGDDVLGADITDSLDGGTGSDTGLTTFNTNLVTLLGSGQWVSIENITLDGTLSIHAIGNAAVNTITGNSAINTITGGGGADTFAGKGGNDIYVVSDSGTYIDEVSPGSGGKDLVRSSVSFALVVNVDDLTLLGTANIDGTGNNSANTITGNSGDNFLEGAAGADSLVGGLGNDSYGVDSASDKLTDTGGIETVYSSITFSLGTGFENLTLVGPDEINGFGNTANNIIIGNGEKNTIDGGTGLDTMAGGGESDTFIIDRLTDIIIENGGEGDHDLILSKFTYSLAAIANVEDLTLTGTTALNGTGNALNNIIRGNTGANTLHGGAGSDSIAGGDGRDILFGDAGGDVFVFEGEGAFTAIDIIKDFNYAEDVINYAGVLIGLDPLYDVFEDFIESRFVGSDEYIYVDRDGFTENAYGLRLMAIIDNP
ncbi:MAG: hypothetical protein ACAH80_06980 [Alphaproteobacteria bacterium]